MGAWGNGPFENDDAADWVYALEDSGVSAIRSAIELGAGDVEAPQAAAAVAAAAVVALARGLDVESTDEVSAWLADADAEQVRSLAPAAAAALDRVLDGSELAELFDETGDDDWRVQVSALRDGLRT